MIYLSQSISEIFGLRKLVLSLHNIRQLVLICDEIMISENLLCYTGKHITCFNNFNFVTISFIIITLLSYDKFE